MQTWKTKNLPKKWQQSQDAIRKRMPDWKYVLMTDEDNRNFVIEHFPEYLKTYDSFKYPIQRVDMIRPMWLYVHGGIYIDLDLVVNKPLDELFKNGADLYFVPSANITMYFTNSFMASRPRHPFWLEYLKHMKKEAPIWGITKHFYVMATTGPIGLTKVIRKTSSVYSILSQKSVIPCNVCNIGKCKGGYLKTIEGQSWNGWDSLAINFLYCNWKMILTVICIIIIIWAIWKYKKSSSTIPVVDIKDSSMSQISLINPKMSCDGQICEDSFQGFGSLERVNSLDGELDQNINNYVKEKDYIYW